MFSFVPAYIAYSIILTLGIVGVIFSNNLVKKILCLNIIQAGCLLFYVSICYGTDLRPPIIKDGVVEIIVNPLPQVLMLTAIVVGLATTTIGLAIVMKIAKLHKTIYRSEIDK
jgi:multicomponent Na+:H+ antiporter subunit C